MDEKNKVNEITTENTEKMTKKNIIILFSLLLVSLLAVIYIIFSQQIPQVDVSSDVSSSDSSEISSEASKDESSTESKEEIKKFPLGVKIHETDVSGMTAEEAKAALDAWAKDYSLTLTVNSNTLTYEASVFGVTFADIDIEKMLTEAKSGMVFEVTEPIVFDETALEKAVYSFPGAYVAPVNASVEYSSSQGSFVISKEKEGSRLDLYATCEAVKEAIKTRASSLSQTVSKTSIAPTVFSTHENANKAVEEANGYLNINLSYTYSPNGSSPYTETLSKAQIADFITTDDNFNVKISDYRINNYCSSMSNKYSASGGYSSFKATGGYTVNISVPSGGHYVDKDSLASDIKSKILNKISGTFAAPYTGTASSSTLNFDGTYIEINLSAQHMWFYKNGNCIISTDIVSGNVATWHHTPTGLFSVTSKAKNISLIGPDYVQPVDYWIGFSDPYYGIHDSLWRTSGYGGTIYLYDGSHGCVNTPHEAVAFIYENVDYFTPVIVFGGEATANTVTQEIEGTFEFNKVLGDEAFTLDAKPKYNTELTYTSENTDILEVSDKGVVTIKKNGTAVITVYAKERQGFTDATQKITVTVKTKCEASGSHSFDEGTVTTTAACDKDGVKTFKCKVCSETKTEAIEKLGHSYDSGVVTTPSTCSAEGVKTFTCSNCNGTKTEPIAKAEHIWDAGTETTPPTCTAEGVKTFTCSVCGGTKTEPISKLDHSYTETVTTPPTCTAEGVKTFTCTCGDSKTESIDKLPHDFSLGDCSCGEPAPTPEP